MEMKGSLFLRSNRTEYGPNILVSNWDQRRDAEPKDYDYTTDPCRNAHLSTYKRFGTREDCPRTSYQHLCEQLFLKPSYEERKFHHPWHSLQSGTTFKTEVHSNAFNCILPRHPPDHNKRYLETTHMTDYKPPYPYKEKKEVVIPDNSAAFKKCISQFTDTDGYKRSGQNTWIDESGIYGNSDFKAQLHKPTLQPELQPDICTHVENHDQQC